MSLREIGKLLSIPKSTVAIYLKRYKEKGSNDRKKCSQGKYILNNSDLKHI